MFEITLYHLLLAYLALLVVMLLGAVVVVRWRRWHARRGPRMEQLFCPYCACRYLIERKRRRLRLEELAFCPNCGEANEPRRAPMP
jgi:hypothetical protein